jgi:hypothetical protein
MYSHLTNIYVRTHVMYLCIAMEPKLLSTFVIYVCGKNSWGILKNKMAHYLWKI